MITRLISPAKHNYQNMYCSSLRRKNYAWLALVVWDSIIIILKFPCYITPLHNARILIFGQDYCLSQHVWKLVNWNIFFFCITTIHSMVIGYNKVRTLWLPSLRRHAMETLPCYWPFVRGFQRLIFLTKGQQCRSFRSLCFLCSQLKLDLPVIWDAMVFMWRLCNISFSLY